MTPVGLQARFRTPPALRNLAPPETPAPDLVTLSAPPEEARGSLKRKLLATTALGLVGLGAVTGVAGYTLRHAPVCPPESGVEICVSPEHSVAVNQGLRALRGLPFRAANAEDLASHESRELRPGQLTSRPLQDDLRVTTWNLHHGDSSDATGARSQVGEMVEQLNEHPSDLYLLQEVSPWHAQQIVDGTGMVGYYTQTQLLQGNLILVHPDLEVEGNFKTLVNLDQPDTLSGGYLLADSYVKGGTEPRVVQALRVREPDGESTLVWNTHLMNGGDGPTVRFDQAQRTLDFVDGLRQPGERVVGGGDFNSPRGSQVQGELDRRYEQFDGARIDYLMANGFSEQLTTQTENLGLSDHPLVSGVLQPQGAA